MKWRRLRDSATALSSALSFDDARCNRSARACVLSHRARVVVVAVAPLDSPRVVLGDARAC
jgi:hypothetical protein